MSKNRWPTLGGGRWGSLHTVRNEFYKDMMRCAPLLPPPCSARATGAGAWAHERRAPESPSTLDTGGARAGVSSTG